MVWYMGLDGNNRPNGWDTKPWGTAIEVTQADYDFASANPDCIWDGEKLIVPVIVPHVLTAEEKEAMLQDKYAQLWKAATDYQERYISGAAIGLLTIGVIQQKSKALAIMAWIQTVWMNHYYPQKALLVYDSEIYDFSTCGAMPYSVPELTAEVLG